MKQVAILGGIVDDVGISSTSVVFPFSFVLSFFFFEGKDQIDCSIRIQYLFSLKIINWIRTRKVSNLNFH